MYVFGAGEPSNVVQAVCKYYARNTHTTQKGTNLPHQQKLYVATRSEKAAAAQKTQARRRNTLKNPDVPNPMTRARDYSGSARGDSARARDYSSGARYSSGAEITPAAPE